MRITDEHLATCRRDGFVIIENFLTESENRAALDGLFRLYSPTYERYVANGRKNDTPGLGSFPFDDSGLNAVALHPEIIDAAERLTGSRRLWLANASLGMRYADEGPTPLRFHYDQSNNSIGPFVRNDAWFFPIFFFCFDDVREGMAPIMMQPHGKTEREAVAMLAPAGSLCIYSLYTLHSASPFTAPAGHRPTMWVTISRKDRLWDGARPPINMEGAGLKRFMAEATPRQRELLGFPPVGDPVWTEDFLFAMGDRYPGFDPEPYRATMSSAMEHV